MDSGKVHSRCKKEFLDKNIVERLSMQKAITVNQKTKKKIILVSYPFVL